MVELDSGLLRSRRRPSRLAMPSFPRRWHVQTGINSRRVIVAASLALADAAAAALAVLAASSLVHAGASRASVGSALTAVLLAVACSGLSGLYRGFGPGPVERLRLRTGATALFLAGRLLSHALTGELAGAIVATALEACLLLLAGFYIELAVRRLLVARGHWSAPTLVIGSGRTAIELAGHAARQPELGLAPVGFLALPGATDAPPEPAGVAALPVVRAGADIALMTPHVEAVLLTAPEQRRQVAELWPDDLPAPRVHLVQDAASLGWPRPCSRLPGGQMAYELTHSDLRSPGNAFLKRALDLAIGVPAGLLALPVVAAAALAIKIIDPGPALYRHPRVGRDGETVTILKLRSMYQDAEQRLEQHLASDPAARGEWDRYFKLSDDPRVLAVIGKLLRKSSLDELPQLWNVIRGDMSLIGPRPFPAYHVESFDPQFRAIRASVAPGLTGLWQVSARSDGDLGVQRSCDLFYIENWSIWLDLYILLQTVPAVLSGRGAR